jgi:hypothetical protein
MSVELLEKQTDRAQNDSALRWLYQKLKYPLVYLSQLYAPSVHFVTTNQLIYKFYTQPPQIRTQDRKKKKKEFDDYF